MEEHKLNYRKEEDRTKGCIHQMSKLSRSLLWRDLCPHLSLRMKKGSLKDASEKKRRRNVFAQYDPTINIRTDIKPDIKPQTGLTNAKTTANSQTVTDPDAVQDCISRNSQPTDPDTVTDSFSSYCKLEEYKDKLRAYAKKYVEDNGVWYNMKDIEEVSLPWYKNYRYLF